MNWPKLCLNPSFTGTYLLRVSCFYIGRCGLVLILLLLELTFWANKKSGGKRHYSPVLILLLLELTFWVLENSEKVERTFSLNPSFTGTYLLRAKVRDRYPYWPQVLILLLLELTFWEKQRYVTVTLTDRLNPSFTGTYLLSNLVPSRVRCLPLS